VTAPALFPFVPAPFVPAAFVLAPFAAFVLAPLFARINFARADQVAGFGIGVTGVCDFIRAGEVDPREQRGGAPACATGGDER